MEKRGKTRVEILKYLLQMVFWPDVIDFIAAVAAGDVRVVVADTDFDVAVVHHFLGGQSVWEIAALVANPNKQTARKACHQIFVFIVGDSQILQAVDDYDVRPAFAAEQGLHRVEVVAVPELKAARFLAEQTRIDDGAYKGLTQSLLQSVVGDTAARERHQVFHQLHREARLALPAAAVDNPRAERFRVAHYAEPLAGEAHTLGLVGYHFVETERTAHSKRFISGWSVFSFQQTHGVAHGAGRPRTRR